MIYSRMEMTGSIEKKIREEEKKSGEEMKFMYTWIEYARVIRSKFTHVNEMKLCLEIHIVYQMVLFTTSIRTACCIIPKKEER